MQTFREFFDERYDFPPGSRRHDYFATLGEAFIDYVDEIVAPVAVQAANPMMVVADGVGPPLLKPGGIMPSTPIGD